MISHEDICQKTFHKNRIRTVSDSDKEGDIFITHLTISVIYVIHFRKELSIATGPGGRESVTLTQR